jgi:hypothetical protein
VKSEPWPSRSAVLEYAAVWTSRRALATGAQRVADKAVVVGITSSLDPRSRVDGLPNGLNANKGIAFIGNFVNGIGFVLSEDEAAAMIAAAPESELVLFSYLNGEDLNSTPDHAARRKIIDFRDWSYEEAAKYPDALARVRELVKPARDAMPDSKRATREGWWRYEKLAPGLRGAIKDLKHVVVLARISKTLMPAMVTAHQVMNEKVVVFATDDTALLALMSSCLHYWWAITHSTTLKNDLSYAPSDVFESFPLPTLTAAMRILGDRLEVFRRDLMLSRQAGLTATYNMVHDPACTDADIAELRDIHRQIDIATVRAYGWSDLADSLDHGFHDTRQGARYTVAAAPRQEILDRLLELNHVRYAEEVKAGLHQKKPARKHATPPPPAEDALF